MAAQEKSLKEFEEKLAAQVKDNDALKDNLKKQEASQANAKKTASE